VSLYLDTSCLLKLLFPEPETNRVMELVAAEEHVVVSTLARLEAFVQVHARAAGGLLTARAARVLADRLDELLRHEPYDVVRTPSDLVDVAEAQVRPFLRDAHCPTLDRLHLAAMNSLEVDRLLTNDGAQARAARALGISVVVARTS
jgi:predicted nucleic acid-binding protein